MRMLIATDAPGHAVVVAKAALSPFGDDAEYLFVNVAALAAPTGWWSDGAHG